MRNLDGQATPLEVRSDILACDCLAKSSFPVRSKQT